MAHTHSKGNCFNWTTSISVLFALKYSMFSELGEKRRKWMGKFGLCPGVIDEVYKHSFGARGWGNLP